MNLEVGEGMELQLKHQVKTTQKVDFFELR
jgi:hypothetical protein